MKLEKNDKYIKADIKNLKKYRLKRLLGLGFAITMFTSSYINSDIVMAQAPRTEIDNSFYDKESGIIDNISINYRISILSSLGKNFDDELYINDLSQITNLSIMLNNDNLTWLNYCTNLESLTLNISNNTFPSTIDNLTNLKELNLFLEDTVILDKDNFNFINKLNLDKLNIYGRVVEADLLPSLTNIKELNVHLTDSEALNLHYQDLINANLKEITFDESTYDLAINLNSNILSEFQKNKIKVNLTNADIDELLKINNELDNIVKGLNIKKDSTDKDKLDAILVYVLEEYSYNEFVNNYLQMDNWRDNEYYNSYISNFYENGTDGYLYGVFNKNVNKQIICGNYAALVESLATRVGLEAYFVGSTNHAWNVVEVEGEKYYVDATWLDIENINNNSPQSLIISGNTDKLKWYMVKPEELSVLDPTDSHQILYNKDNYIYYNQGIEKHMFIIDTNNKKYLINGAVLIGILVGLGKAKKVRSKNYLNHNINTDSKMR